VKITEQKISYKETVRGKQPESRETKISISSASSPSRTPSPFLKPHERKDYVPPPSTKQQVEVQKSRKVIVKEKHAVSSNSENDETESKPKSAGELKKDLQKLKKADKSLKKKTGDEPESRKRAANDISDAETLSEKSKKRKRKNRDGSVSDDSEKKKKRSKAKKHKKSSKKSKKKDRSVSRDKSSASEEESNVNEDLEKKLRQKALVSLMRSSKKAQ
jgi:serine/arginine repetitive matrix protein 1